MVSTLWYLVFNLKFRFKMLYCTHLTYTTLVFYFNQSDIIIWTLLLFLSEKSKLPSVLSSFELLYYEKTDELQSPDHQSSWLHLLSVLYILEFYILVNSTFHRWSVEFWIKCWNLWQITEKRCTLPWNWHVGWTNGAQSHPWNDAVY